jgi:hypothetical protein
MLKRVIVVCTVLAFLVIAFWVGRAVGLQTAIKLRTKQELEQHDQLVALDRSWLTNVVTRPSTMTSGVYTLEIRLAGRPVQASTVEFDFSKREFIKGSKLVIWNVVQTGNAVSWEQHETEDDEEPNATLVGLVDGNGIWGRVYVAPGEGWHEGEPPAYGVWRLYPKSDKSN